MTDIDRTTDNATDVDVAQVAQSRPVRPVRPPRRRDRRRRPVSARRPPATPASAVNAGEAGGRALPAAILRLGASLRRRPRAAVTVLALVVLGLGAVGLVVALRVERGVPRQAFADAGGDAGEIRERVRDSIVDGEASQSLAPGLGSEAAAALVDAPLYFITASVDPDEVDPSVLTEISANQRVVFENTGDEPVDEARFDVMAEASSAGFDLLSDGRLRDGELVVDLGGDLAPGAGKVVDIAFRLRPNKIDETAEIGDVLTGAETTPTNQVARRNLTYALDWYPQLQRLDADGWKRSNGTVDAADMTGPASVVHLDVSYPAGWRAAIGGTAVESDWVDGPASSSERSHQRNVAVGARALPVVLMRNAHETTVEKGEFAAHGLSLDTFGETIDEATAEALFAQAALGETYQANLWRDTHVVSLVLGGGHDAIVADNVILLDQDLVAQGSVHADPGSQASRLRERIYEGVAAQWWGGRVGIDADALAAWPHGFRRWGAVDVWRRVGGDGLADFASARFLAGSYRDARRAETADVPASGAYGDYKTVAERELAVSKIGLAVRSAEVSLGPVGVEALRELQKPLFADIDVDAVIKAFGVVAGDETAARTALEPILTGVAGDRLIGLAGGEGAIGRAGDETAASSAAQTRPEGWIVDLDSIAGYGQGW